MLCNFKKFYIFVIQKRRKRRRNIKHKHYTTMLHLQYIKNGVRIHTSIFEEDLDSYMKKEKLTPKDIDGNNYLFYEICNPYMKESVLFFEMYDHLFQILSIEDNYSGEYLLRVKDLTTGQKSLFKFDELAHSTVRKVNIK